MLRRMFSDICSFLNACIISCDAALAVTHLVVVLLLVVVTLQ